MPSSTNTRGIRCLARRFGVAIGLVSMPMCGALLLQACDSKFAVMPVVVPAAADAESSVVGSAIVGTALASPVRLLVTGTDGKPIAGVKVSWVAEDGFVSSADAVTDDRGTASVRWTLGTTAGLQSLTAFVAGLAPVRFGANAIPDRAAVVRFSNDLIRVTLIGDTLRFTTTVRDQYGNSVTTPVALALVGASNVLVVVGTAFVARTRGTAVIRATADTATSRLTVLVDPSPPELARISPDTLQPGGPIVIDGLGFALIPDAVEVSVAGVKALITKVSASRVEALLPNSYGCRATVPQSVKVTVAGFTAESFAVLRTSKPLSLARGESANLLHADDVRCAELLAPPGAPANVKYVVAVINTSVTAASTSGFELRGAGAGAMAGRVSVGRPASVAVQAMSESLTALSANASSLAQPRRGASPTPVIMAAEALSETQHHRYLETQRAVGLRYGSPAATWRARASSRVAASRALAAAGDTIVLKALYSSCTSGRDVRARVVYTGSKAVVLEDIASDRAGTMDTEYRWIGDEYDRVQYPLMQSKVGDPLAMNETMGGDGRVTMLFTRYLNDSLPGISGYVSACNFYPKSTFATSNEDEIFYARVPGRSESISDWRRAMRGTIIHESKHLASFAIRFVDGTPFEESWLEESTGRIAEELYARTFNTNTVWRGNIGFEKSIGCELSQCDGRPLMMWKHFSVLHQYLRGVDTLTPIGAAANGDFTFYASGWSLVRWAADHYASDESVWLKALIRGGQLTGLSNLAERTGRPAGEMLADWSLMNAVDDLADFVPARARLTFPSWNVANIFAELATAFPGSFLAHPLRSRPMTFGAFSVPVAKLRAFSSSYFSFEGVQFGSQILELRGDGGASPPPAVLRLAVVRVE